MQFARVAHATDFLYCYSIIEENKRSEYASSSGPAMTARHWVNPALLGMSVQTELNTFFPFGPYKLPRSGAYIEGVYREWASVAIESESDDEDEDEDEYDESYDRSYNETYEDGPSEEPPNSSSYSLSDGFGFSGSSPIAFASSPRRQNGHDAAADQLGASFSGMSISPAHAPISMSLNSVMSVSMSVS